MADRCPTKVVGDAPAALDEFGSHGPIADAICDLIETESGGRTIGLEGGWGSGKSTVAKLLADRLKGQESHVVLFDTWAHEGDPLRRSFLEELIGSLVAKSWVDKETWTNRREALAKRRRVEHTRPVAKLETPVIVAGIVAVCFAVLIAIGATLINAGLAGSETVVSEVIVGAVLAGIPILFTGAAAVLFKSRWGSGSVTWPSLFSVQSVTESTSETIETPDPTSIEFESTFKDLMRCALQAIPSRRRLILVVDNLDRVAPSDARTIWATLQTFLHHSQENREPWLDSLWVLLPYDPTGIRRLWDGRVLDDTRPGGGDASAAPEGQGNSSVAESFIEKSVQVRFEVPLPLMSDWREYLESKLQLALPRHDVADFYGAYRLYARKVTDAGRAPTPRELKQYVNRIGALHRRWQDILPLTSLACYAVLNLDGAEVTKGLREGTLPDPALSGLLDDGVEGHLAALAFNTDQERAQQLLLGPLVEGALTGPRRPPGELNALLGRPGFWEVLVQVRFSEWHSELPSLLTAARRLRLIPKDRRPAAEWGELTSALGQAGRDARGWPALTARFANNLGNLLLLVDDDSRPRIARRATAAEVGVDGATDWAEGAHAFLTQNDGLSIRAAGSAEAIYAVLARFGEIPDASRFAARLQVAPTGREELDQLIVAGMTGEPGHSRRALEVLSVVEAEVNWTPFSSAAVDNLRAPITRSHPPPDASQSQELLRILRLAGQDSSAALTGLVRDGAALDYMVLASEEGKNDALGDWLYEELRGSPDSTHQGRLRFSRSAVGGEEVARLRVDPKHAAIAPLAQAICRQGDFDLIASIAAGSDERTLPAALIAQLWESEEFAGAITGDRLLTLWPDISQAGMFGDHDPTEFIGLVGRRAELVAELTSAEFTTARMGMYANVLAAHPDRDEAVRLAKWAVVSLEMLNPGQWSAAMDASDDWIELLVAVREVAPQSRIGGGFALGLGKYLERVADGTEVSEPIAREWERAVVASVAPSIRGAYVEEVAAAAGRGKGQLPEVFFGLVGRTLRTPDIFARPAVLNAVLPSLVMEENRAGLSWLIQTLQDDGVRASVAEDGFAALIEAVSASLDPTKDARNELVQLAGLLDIPVESQIDHQEGTGAAELGTSPADGPSQGQD